MQGPRLLLTDRWSYWSYCARKAALENIFPATGAYKFFVIIVFSIKRWLYNRLYYLTMLTRRYGYQAELTL